MAKKKIETLEICIDMAPWKGKRMTKIIKEDHVDRINAERPMFGRNFGRGYQARLITAQDRRKKWYRETVKEADSTRPGWTEAYIDSTVGTFEEYVQVCKYA